MTHEPTRIRGRFAPSPTGRMHLGNALAALLCWLGARSAEGDVILRIEDIDPARSRREFAHGIMEDLQWLGLDWDEGPGRGGPFGPYTQNERRALYDVAVASLKSRNLIYPCFCTRRELRKAASAPHRRNAGPGYPGFCRDLSPEQIRERRATGRSPAWRFRFPEEIVTFRDLCLGDVTLDTRELGGDFPVQRSDGVPAYQLAVVTDDIAMHVNQVVRGEDLLDSTPRQTCLYRAFNAQPPSHAHVPLLVDENGMKLSKRHHSLELAALRQQGIRPEAVIGHLAHLSGLADSPRPIRAAELVDGFDFSCLRRGPLVVSEGVEHSLDSMRPRTTPPPRKAPGEHQQLPNPGASIPKSPRVDKPRQSR